MKLFDICLINWKNKTNTYYFYYPLSIHKTSALRQENRVRRRSERVAARTILEVHRQIVQDMYRRRNEQLVEANTSYFTKKVEESKVNPKALFRLTRNMMGNSGETILPLHTCM